MKRYSFALVVAILGSAPLAQADRKNPLEGQPAIRRRVELRNFRLEVTPFVGFTMLQDFNNTILGGAKVAYHLSDWLAVGGAFGGGAATDTGLKTRVLGTLGMCGSTPSDPSPTQCQASDAMNHIAWMAALMAEFTPFGGKLALFSKSFLNYDFYIDGGAGFVGLANDLKQQPTCSGMNSMPGCNTGTKIGPMVAAGVHVFLTNMLALQLEYRSIIVKDNQSGFDVTGDKIVNDDDQKWGSKNFVTLGVSLFLPASPEISK